MVNPVKKGKSGEREFLDWIEKNLGETVDREYNQSQGGCDIITSRFYFEVKRRECLDLSNWWYQVRIASICYNEKSKNNFNQRISKPKDLMPVVAFRQNRGRWEFLIPASIIGVDTGYLRLTEKVFIEFALND